MYICNSFDLRKFTVSQCELTQKLDNKIFNNGGKLTFGARKLLAHLHSAKFLFQTELVSQQLLICILMADSTSQPPWHVICNFQKIGTYTGNLKKIRSPKF